MSERNVEVVRRIWELWSRGAETNDPRLLAAPFDEGLIAADSTFTPNPDLPGTSGEAYTGLEGFRRFVRVWTEGWRDWRIALEEVLYADEEHVVARIHQSAVGKVSGVAVEFRYAMVLRMVDGQVVDRHDYTEDEEALASIGRGSDAPDAES